jgi:DNA helicase HerA-like ATPase
VGDMVFHSVFIGSTGAGKTNALIYWLLRLFTDTKDVAFVLTDPHGDAAIDLVRAISRTEREGVTILDPTYVSFGLNPLSLPRGVELKDRVLPLYPGHPVLGKAAVKTNWQGP